MMTGGSDCHQRPVIMGSLDIPGEVLEPFGLKLEKEHHDLDDR